MFAVAISQSEVKNIKHLYSRTGTEIQIERKAGWREREGVGRKRKRKEKQEKRKEKEREVGWLRKESHR